MTTTQIRKELSKAGKEVSRAQLYRYLAACKISPSGANQRPQRYPLDTAERILTHLGFTKLEEPATKLVMFPPELRIVPAKSPAKIVTLKQLKKHQPRRGK
ncbi:MAG: hypothetical protein WCS42_04700 [Verrucomicrobiota bacterium]